MAEGSRVGISIQVEGLSKSFGSAKIWEDVTLDIPAGEVSVLLGPSGLSSAPSQQPQPRQRGCCN